MRSSNHLRPDTENRRLRTAATPNPAHSVVRSPNHLRPDTENRRLRTAATPNPAHSVVRSPNRLRPAAGGCEPPLR
ncbi:MAG: hypothetical protein BroJett021_41790 [Chloroflexota bacterium]|nr:MAG: hypothetical protein BroJett021_41790 [Chloroflexota bacterium]